jgi:hypothetical protein
MSLLLFYGFAFFSGGLFHYELSQFLVAHYYIIRGLFMIYLENASLSFYIYFPYLKGWDEVFFIFVVGL